MALVTMTAPAASACGVLHALSVPHQGLRCIASALGAAAVRISQPPCEPRSRTAERRVRVRGERLKAMAESPGTASAESATVSIENFSSVEELKAVLLGSLEGAHLFQVAFRCC
jgi:hypothetical protein